MQIISGTFPVHADSGVPVFRIPLKNQQQDPAREQNNADRLRRGKKIDPDGSAVVSTQKLQEEPSGRYCDQIACCPVLESDTAKNDKKCNQQPTAFK